MEGVGQEFLKILKGISWDSLDAKSAVELREALKTALANADTWFAELSKHFGYPPLPPANLQIIEAKPAKVPAGRPPEDGTIPPAPVKAPPAVTRKAQRRRGRPPAKAGARIQLRGNRGPRPSPIDVGGANAGEDAPKPAQIFENSYISKDGPQGPADLPADHPRLRMNRESSITPEVDMSDFAEVEAQVRAGRPVKNIFQ